MNSVGSNVKPYSALNEFSVFCTKFHYLIKPWIETAKSQQSMYFDKIFLGSIVQVLQS